MKILITNDDGFSSSGILASKKAVESLGETIVVAPATQQSGIGRAITLFEPLRINEHRLKDGSKAYSVSGTPTDAVTLGLFEILEEKPDLCISGINIGKNIAKAELTTSGTIGAAMEAASYGIPTIAISQEVIRGDIKFEDGHIELDFEIAKRTLNTVAKKILKYGLPEGVDLVNLNIPAHPKSEDILITRLGKRMYTAVIEKRLDPREKPYYWIDGVPYEDEEEGTDSYGLKINKQPTLTPLTLDSTSNLDLLNDWF